MKIIYNRWFPFGSYSAINILGVVFAKNRMNKVERNHEFIHTLQQRELLFVGFYLLYVIEWLVRLVQHRSLLKAYLAVSFEREAYAHQFDFEYKKNRHHYAWRLYI